MCFAVYVCVYVDMYVCICVYADKRPSNEVRICASLEGVVEEGTTPLSKHVWYTVSSQSINIVSCNMEPLSEGMWRALLIRFHGRM